MLCAFVFTALQLCRRGLPMRICLSVRVSDKRVDCEKTTQISADILTPYERPIHLVFRQEEWLERTAPSTWNFGANWPPPLRNSGFQSLFARTASVLRPSEGSSIMTNRKSTTSFLVSLRWTAYVAPNPFPKGDSKRKMTSFPLKVYFARRKSAAKLLCVKTFSGKV